MGFFGFKKVSKAPAPVPPPPPRPSAPTTDLSTSQTPPPPYQQASYPPPTETPYSQPSYSHSIYPSQPSFQPAGLLPPPAGWTGSAQSAPPPHNVSPPIIVNHHYYLAPPPGFQPSRPQMSGGPLQKFHMGSVLDLAETLCPGTGVPKILDDNLIQLSSIGTQLARQGALVHDQLTARFNDIMTMVEQGRCTGNERDLLFLDPRPSTPSPANLPLTTASTEMVKKGRKGKTDDQPKGQTTAVASSLLSGNYIAKVELYANSRLPLNLAPLKLYIPTYPLLCLAAQYSNRVYETPKGSERNFHINSNWRSGTKAMIIKSVPMDHMNTIVFAIRGTASFMDWNTNLDMEPVSPVGFLDDPGNFCHTGFLSVARKTVAPVAKRLRQLLEENPGRSSYSLLITGHSAGGAVAALLYSHMLATSRQVDSELNRLANRFLRVHCVTFGSPPVSLLPLAKPADTDRRPELRKSVFLSFVNEGDPVARADLKYVRSLLELFAAPAPVSSQKEKAKESKSQVAAPKEKKSKASLTSAKAGKSGKTSSSTKPPPSSASSGSTKSRASGPTWKVPPCALSNAGRIVVLRSGDPKSRSRGTKTVEERLNEGVVAQIATDEQLRGMIWGDPVAHNMKLYLGRIETLAVGAVTAKGY